MVYFCTGEEKPDDYSMQLNQRARDVAWDLLLYKQPLHSGGENFLNADMFTKICSKEQQ